MEDPILMPQILEDSCSGNSDLQPSTHRVQTLELQNINQSHPHTFSTTSNEMAPCLVNSSEGLIFMPDGMVTNEAAPILKNEHPTVSHVRVGYICDGSCEIEELCFKKEPLEETKQRYMEVFSHVQATIAFEYLNCLSMQAEDVLKKLQEEMKLNVKFSDEENTYIVQGSFSEVVQCKQTLESLLHNIDGEDSSFPAQCMSRDSSVICELPQSLECTDRDYSEPDATLHSEETSPTVSNTRKCRDVDKKELTDDMDELLQVNSNDHEQEMSISLEKISSYEETQEKKEDEPFIDVTINKKGNFVPVPPTIDKSRILPKKTKMGILDKYNEKQARKKYEDLAPFKFFCTKCSFKSKRESHFQKHMKLHEKSSPVFRCDNCDFTTLRMGHLRRHYVLHSSATHKCDECDYETDNRKFLVRHKRMRHNGNEHLRIFVLDGLSGGCKDSTFYQCTMCEYNTYRKEHYYRHVNNVHVNKRPYLCDLCGKAFKRTDALKQHQVTHGEDNSRGAVFHCKVCGKGCRSQTQLVEHTSVHSNIRSFLCEICGASFKTRSVQRKHVITIHKNPRSHACRKCMKRFNTHYALRRHMKQHSEEDEVRKGVKDAEQPIRQRDRMESLQEEDSSGDTYLIQSNKSLADNILHEAEVLQSSSVQSTDDIDKLLELSHARRNKRKSQS